MALANLSRWWILCLSLRTVTHAHPRVHSKMAFQTALASIRQHTGDILYRADEIPVYLGVKFPVAIWILFSTAPEP